MREDTEIIQEVEDKDCEMLTQNCDTEVSNMISQQVQFPSQTGLVRR